ncbi:hypothetical protein L6452_34666 [Arctium lappa]|uniref:Uncharacterized protein n=1 Tax=Arctium lappa TaxID=4217 RepID=A0ACB8YI37_ARCLA|nr:hypothetical protein L6452_34666 [Arctium lappa]
MESNTLSIQDIVMELNDKFALLMHTKVEVKTVIERAKDIFPYETLFDRYQDELATLFNEEGLRGSSEIKKTIVHTREECLGKTNQPKDGSQPPSVQEGGRMCTPTKLNFDNANSLEEQSPLSPYWYSQTTFGLIDAQIMEQSGGSKEEGGQPCNNVKEADFPIVPYVEEDVEPIRTIPVSPSIPVPSFNLGISQPCDSPNASGKGKEPIIYADEHCKPVRRELKIGEQMKSPYVKRQVVIAKNLTAEEKKVHEWSLTAFGGAE